VKHCANDSCPELLEHGIRGEFRDEISICPGCSLPLTDGPAPDLRPPPEWMELVEVASFTHVASAHVERAALEAAEIPAFVTDENLASMQWLYTSAVGGVRLLVPVEHADAARAIVEADRSTSTSPSDADRCPTCGAEAGPPSKPSLRSRALSLLVGIPFVFWRRTIRCNRCGRRWRRGQDGAS